jgi:hypothetical protein
MPGNSPSGSDGSPIKKQGTKIRGNDEIVGRQNRDAAGKAAHPLCRNAYGRELSHHSEGLTFGETEISGREMDKI